MNSIQELVFHICIHVYVFLTGISLFFEKQQIFMKIQLGVKTNGNFGGFPVGNDILSNFGISLGNPHDVCYLKNLHSTYYTQVVDYLYQYSAFMPPPSLLPPPNCQHGIAEIPC